VTILLEGAWTAGKALKPYNTEVTYSSVFRALRWVIWRADSVSSHERLNRLPGPAAMSVPTCG